MTFVGQDWGGLIGLRLVAEHPERFARVVVANTGLPVPGDVSQERIDAVRAFRRDAPTPTLPEMMQVLGNPDSLQLLNQDLDRVIAHLEEMSPLAAQAEAT